MSDKITRGRVGARPTTVVYAADAIKTALCRRRSRPPALRLKARSARPARSASRRYRWYWIEAWRALWRHPGSAGQAVSGCGPTLEWINARSGMLSNRNRYTARASSQGGRARLNCAARTGARVRIAPSRRSRPPSLPNARPINRCCVASSASSGSSPVLAASSPAPRRKRCV